MKVGTKTKRMAIAMMTPERIGSHRWWVKSVGGVKGIWDSGYYIELGTTSLATPTIGRNEEGEGVLTPIEEEEIVRFVEKMARIRHPMSLT
jgi:hypothetical protein